MSLGWSIEVAAGYQRFPIIAGEAEEEVAISEYVLAIGARRSDVFVIGLFDVE